MNILVKKDPVHTEVVRPEWNPFRLMRDWLRWDPFAEMAPLIAAEPRLTEFMPQFEIKETKEAYVFRADLPGIVERDLDVNLAGNRLTIAGKREAEKEDKTEKYYAYERTYVAFTRTFTLPEGADTEHLAADLKNGVLTLVVPKRAEIQPKKIVVKAGEKHPV